MGARFEKLRREIYEEYREKGYSKIRADRIAFGTAAKIYREKQAKKRR